VGSDETGRVAWTVDVGGRPREVAATHTLADGSVIACVTVDDGTGEGSAAIWWSAAPDAVRHVVTGLEAPRGVAWDYGGGFLVACSGSDRVLRIGLGETPGIDVPRIVASYPTGRGPTAVAPDPVGLDQAFTADRGDGTVSVIDLADPAEGLQPLPVPGIRTIATLVSQ
jgi:DNA-binding beta-propeller fold protein YncE